MQQALRYFVHAVVAGGLLTGTSLAGSLPGQVPALWGLGEGGGPVDHHAAPAPVTGQKAGATTTITDPAGDLFALTTLYPHPNTGRNVAVAGRSLTAVVPKWILGNPGSLTWLAGTYDYTDSEIQYDQVPTEER